MGPPISVLKEIGCCLPENSRTAFMPALWAAPWPKEASVWWPIGRCAGGIETRNFNPAPIFLNIYIPDLV